MPPSPATRARKPSAAIVLISRTGYGQRRRPASAAQATADSVTAQPSRRWCPVVVVSNATIHTTTAVAASATCGRS